MPAPRIQRTVPRKAKERKPGMDLQHLKNIRQLPCVVCGRAPCGEAHHLLRIFDGMPKGMGRRNADRWAIPLDRQCHHEAHMAGNDDEWLAGRGVAGRELAASLWAARGDLEAMRRIAFRHRQGAAL